MSAPPALLADALRDRYTLAHELGQGGMATVYLGRERKHDRDVAVKVLRPELAAVLGRERFLSEIRLTAKLDHPHILTLLDSGESDGFVWYVLPYIRGESLRAKLDRERQVSLSEAVSIARQIAGALEYAHQQGIIHRDVKPENILLHEGEAMLTDFGIALAMGEAGGPRLTETGLSLGTPRYMSPEQATAERLDARSDVYSLGAVLYEMLSGEPPFSGATAQAVIARLMTERPTPLRTLRDTVPPGVEAAVAQALAKVPADRFPSAAAFADALTAPNPSRTLRPLLRQAVPLAILAALAAAGFGASWIWGRTGAGRDRPESSPTASATPGKVAVLSFANLSLDTADVYLARGIGEEIAARLGGYSDISVAGRSTVARLERADRGDVSEQARALGLRHLVEGSVRRSGERIRVSVQLVNAADGFRTWSQSYDRAAVDMLDWQDEIAVDVARALVPRLAPLESRVTRAKPTRNPVAYDRLLRGNHYLADRNPRGLTRAIEEFTEATRLDSTFALAWARLASAYGLLLDWGWDYGRLPTESLLARGWEAGERAIQLDSTLAEAWQVRGKLLRLQNPGSFAGVREAAERSIHLDPQSAEAHHEYGMTLRLLADEAAAAAQFRAALAIEPDRPVTLLHLAWIDMAQRRYQDARRWLDSATKVSPGFYQAYAERAELRLVTADTAGARADAETAVRLRPSEAGLAGESVLLALDQRSGNTARARARLARLSANPPRPEATSVHQAAAWGAVLVAAGNGGQAIDFLERVRVAKPHLRFHLEEVYFDAVRSNPRFQRLIAGMRVAAPE